ncbi:MAG: radical SAM protein [Deltaproteobacteria bacterium]|nr:radical SAM protein [Deltaproteobacteria bacterium]
MGRARFSSSTDAMLEVEAASSAPEACAALSEAFAGLRAASARDVVARLGRDQGYRIEDLVRIEARGVALTDVAVAHAWLRRRLPPSASIEIVPRGPDDRGESSLVLTALLAPRADERARTYAPASGKLDVESVELHIVEHCNLRCAQCCNVSPYLSERVMSVDDVAQTCARLREVTRPAVLKLMGGEPLLHPDLAGVLRAVRASGVAPRVRLFTNGLLLRSVPNETFALLDELTVSSYASAPVKPEILAETEERARRFDVVLNVKDVATFTTVLSARANDDEASQRAYDTCWLRHRCLVVRGGVFYKCTRAAYHTEFHARVDLGGAPGAVAGADEAEALQRSLGIPLDAVDFVDRAAAYLSAAEALPSCRHCHGSAGPLAPHVQLRRRDVARGLLAPEPR